ncbi:GrpE, mitochondrial [Blastocladiella emersonii ATCC 22665]|nr:GrpE, mitochondrial [Blastocladiella emersonii ATCC 22665]
MFVAAIRTAAVARAAAAMVPARALSATAARFQDAAAKPAAEGETAAPSSADAEAAAKATAELSAQVDKLTSQLKDKDVKLSELTDHYRRALADAENLRERTKREVEHAHQFAVQKFAKDLLSIADVLALALDSVKPDALAASKDLKNLHEGLTLTSDELHKTFHRHGVERIDAVEGDKFDHNLHQALFQAPVPGREPGTLLQVAKAGYMLKGRVLRPAQVGVVQDPNA